MIDNNQSLKQVVLEKRDSNRELRQSRGPSIKIRIEGTELSTTSNKPH